MKKHKIIIDTDPGVDDTLTIIYALNEPKVDIKLFSICPGNINSDIGVRNACHLIDLYHKDVPVVQGPAHAMKRVSEDAAFLHGDQGLGGYIPPKETKHQPLKENFVEAMYRVIKENPHEITIIAIAPHTNLGHLLTKHPDAKGLIKQIIFEGAAPFGLPFNPNYNSFNARVDPEAQKIVLESGIPIVMITSEIGRFFAHFTESMINELPYINDTTRFIHKTCEIYWEPGAPDKRIATNDTCALMYLLYPKIFKTKRAIVTINTTDNPGKNTAIFDKNGNVDIVVDLNRKKFFKMIYKKFHELDDFKFDEDILGEEIQNKRKKALAKELKTEIENAEKGTKESAKISKTFYGIKKKD